MQDEEWLEQIEISLTEEEIEALGWQPKRNWWAMGCFVFCDFGWPQWHHFTVAETQA